VELISSVLPEKRPTARKICSTSHQVSHCYICHLLENFLLNILKKNIQRLRYECSKMNYMNAKILALNLNVRRCHTFIRFQRGSRNLPNCESNSSRQLTKKIFLNTNSILAGSIKKRKVNQTTSNIHLMLMVYEGACLYAKPHSMYLISMHT